MSIRMAAKVAKQSTFKRHRLGAVVVKGHRILSTGYNEVRYSKLTGKHTLHAEASAIIKLLKSGHQNDLVGSTLYVTRFTRGGAVGMAKPCVDCYNLCRAVGITNVIYSNEEGGVSTLKL